MVTVEKVSLELWDTLFCTFPDRYNIILDSSIKFKDKTSEVTLTTREHEYIIVLSLLEPISSNNQMYYFKKCTSEGKYKIECLRLKGFDAVEFGKANLRHLKLILEELAENHVKCMKENNAVKYNNSSESYLVNDIPQEPFIDVLHSILEEKNKDELDQIVFMDGAQAIEKKYESLLKLHDKCVFVDETNVQYKLFVKHQEHGQGDYKILAVKTGRKIPAIFDLLQTIFYFADQLMCQDQFHNLLDHYYKSLENKLQKMCLNVDKLFPKFESQICEFTPKVKLHILKKIMQQFVDHKRSNNNQINKETLYQFKTDIWSLLLEVNECILYPNLTREDCYKILKNKIGSSEYTFLKYKLIHLLQREGFLGDYFKLNIEIEHNGEVESLHLFAKYLPTYSELTSELGYQSFKKEEFYYLKLIPELNDLGLGEITDFLPKCYLSRTNEVLIFDDLAMMNYKTFDVSVPYTYEMLSMAIKQLAKIHACSLIYEEYASEKCKEIVTLDTKYPEYVEEMFMLSAGEQHIIKCIQCSIKTISKILEVFPAIPKTFSMEEFKRRVNLELDLCFEKVKKSNTYRNVLGHGDMWASNIMFKSDKEGHITDCKILDYQLTRYCPPTQDIFFLLYMTSTKDVRKKNELKLLDEYYSQLSTILEKYRVDLQKIYTHEQFLDCCSYMRSQGVCHSLLVLHLVSFSKDKLEDILQDEERTNKLFYENRDILINELYSESPYTQRIRELVEELYEICEGGS